MKGYELIKEINERKIKNNTTIKVKMGNAYKVTLKYENLMLKWESGDFDTSILCSEEADFEVIEENKEIEELEINEYRQCKVIGRKCLFHQWIKKNDILKNEYLLGLIEFEDGHLEEVSINNIIFDDNKIEEYYLKEREEQ